MKVYLHSVGCRLNQSEIETMARQLLANGHEIAPDAGSADAIILNSCAVTAQAEKDVRRLTRKIHRQNNRANITLTGCYATIAPEQLAALPGVERVTPNQRKSRLVTLLDPQARIDLPLFDQEPVARDFLGGVAGNTRAFVKAQDGCNHKCAFCVTTIARGAGRSRPLGDVVAEIQGLAAAGYQEAVLTGVHLGSYGHDFGDTAGLKALTAAILTHTDIPRVRLSSLEPWDIPAGFFELWQNPRLLPHLHMPLQAGCDHTLRRMARRARCQPFRELAAAARAGIPNLNLSTDIIAGFPGETAADFAESLAFVQEIGFARLHVFGYSLRPGTAAAGMPDQIPPRQIKERVNCMIRLGDELSLAFHQNMAGKTAHVLWERAVGGDEAGLRWVGYTENYLRVHAYGDADLFNRVTPVLLRSATKEGMVGNVLPAAIGAE